MGVLLLTLVATMTLFVAEPDIAHAQVSADTTLSALEITGSPGNVEANITPTFMADETAYEARIPFITTGVAVTATVNQEDATIKVNGRDATSADPHILPGLTAGRVNDVNIVVTAESGDKQTYTVKVYRERQTLSDNANLRSLSISPGRLPGFSASETSYNARVTADEVTVSYRLSDTAGGASAAITAPTSDVDGMDVTLGAESTTTTITVQVTAENGDEKDYSISVYHVRANPETDATLSALAIAAIPAADANNVEDDITTDIIFAAATTEYKARVQTNVAMLTVTAMAEDEGAIVTLPRDQNGNIDGNQVILRKGALTTFTVSVVAEDPTSTMTYTVEVYRNSDVTADLSTDADLTSLSLSAGALSPSFTRDGLAYEATVDSDVEKVTVSYRLSSTSGAADAVVTATGTNVPVDDNEVTLAAHGADTTITITVTPESGGTGDKAYVITVYRTRIAPSADATLAELEVPGVTPALDLTATTEEPIGRMHNVSAPNGTGTVTVTAEAAAEDNGATVEIDPVSPVALTAGMTTTITITVTAEDGATTSEYMVNVYRQREELSEDATLSALGVSDGTLSPAFMSDRMDYNARVGSDVDKVTVSYTPTDNAGGVGVAVNATESDGTTTCDGDNTCDVDRMEVTLDGSGSQTIISLAVTPESGEADDAETYMVTVYRERRNLETEAGLSRLTITDNNPQVEDNVGTWELLPNPGQDVGYRVRSVVVTATPMDSAGGAVATITAPPDNDPTTADHEIALTAGAETVITVVVQAEDPAAPTKTYTARVYRQNLSRSDDATLSSLMLSGVTLMYKDDNDMDMAGFMPDVMDYTGDAGSEMTTVTAMASHLGAQSGITVTYGTNDTEAMMGDDGGYEITLGDVDAELSIMVQVRPESVDATDITTTNDCNAVAADRSGDIECYTVTVTRAEEAGTLLSMYDADGDGQIDISEVSTAIDDFFDGQLGLDEVSAVIDLFFQ